MPSRTATRRAGSYCSHPAMVCVLITYYSAKIAADIRLARKIPRFSAISVLRQTVDRTGPDPYGPRLITGLTAGPAKRGFCLEARATMKIVNSLKSAKKRDKNCRIVRRKGRIYVINKKNPRMKARQG